MVLIGLTILLISDLSQAQQSGRQGPPPLPNDEQIDKMVADLATELSLTEAQEKQVFELYFAHFEEVSEIREEHKKSRDADREEIEQLRTSFEKDVKSHLTKEQQEQFDEFRKKQSPRKGGQKRQKK